MQSLNKKISVSEEIGLSESLRENATEGSAERKSVADLHRCALSASKNLKDAERELIRLIEEIDERRLYLELGFSSLFNYLVESLELTEAQAFAYSSVIRKSREIPELGESVRRGDISIYKAQRIVPIINSQNKGEWIQKASSLTKAALEREVIAVKPDAFRRELIRMVAPDRHRLSLEISEDMVRNLKRVQNLVSTQKRRNLTLEECFEEVIEFFLLKRDPLKKNKEGRNEEQTKSRSREARVGPNRELENQSNQSAIAAPCPGKVDSLGGSGASPKKVERMIRRPLQVSTKRSVLVRDRAGCDYKAPDGRRCSSERFVQIHHLRPWSQGGGHEVSNLQTLCYAHHKMKHEREGPMKK